MTLSVADIGKLAFDGVAAALSGVVHDARLTWDAKGDYDIDAGKRTKSKRFIDGRAVEDASKPVADIFPDYTKGPADRMVLLEGLVVAPQETMRLCYSDRDLTITAVADIAGGGGLYYVMAR